MTYEDVERIAIVALRELGVGDSPLTITPTDGEPDRWEIAVGGSDPFNLTIRAGPGTTANFVREQIFAQFSGK